MIGLLSDSQGDLDAFNRALELLRAKGAKRFFFAGNRYSDLDEWALARRELARGKRDYTDRDFLADVTSWLTDGEQVDRPPAFGEEALATQREEQELLRLKDKFVRTPERDSTQYTAPAFPRKAVDMLGDVLCCIVHDKNDLDKEDLLNAAIFIHGKEPEPKVVQIGPRYFITPGKLTGESATCALIDTSDKQLRVSAFTLDGQEVFTPQALVFGGRTKLSVK